MAKLAKISVYTALGSNSGIMSDLVGEAPCTSVNLHLGWKMGGHGPSFARLVQYYTR